MNYKQVTINHYLWFEAESYGMDLQTTCNIDLDRCIELQIKEHCSFIQNNHISLKNKKINGHIVKSYHYYDESRYIVNTDYNQTMKLRKGV